MKQLVDELSAVNRISRSAARASATHVIRLLEAKVHAGEPIDFGFMQIEPRKVKPAEIKFNIDPSKPGRHFLGEGVRWRVRMIKSWLIHYKPPWSRY